jgi:hypothetical protein
MWQRYCCMSDTVGVGNRVPEHVANLVFNMVTFLRGHGRHVKSLQHRGLSSVQLLDCCQRGYYS